MKLIALLLCGLLAVSCVSGSKVLDLDESNFDDAVASHDVLLVEFFAPWCGHCKRLAPEFDQAADTLAPDFEIAKVDCTADESKALCSKYGVEGFPTLKLFRNDGSEPSGFDAARQADAIVQFVRKAALPAVTVVSDKDAVEALTASSDVVVVGFFEGDVDNKKSDSRKISSFWKFASGARAQVTAAISSSAELAAEYGASVPGVVVVRTFDEPVVVFEGDFDGDLVEDLAEFVATNSLPLVGEIGPQNYKDYVERGLPLFWLFVTEDTKDAVMEAAQAVAGDFTSVVSFVYLDGKRWEQHANGLGVDSIPGYVLEDSKSRKNYVVPEGEISAELFRTHVEGFQAGTLEAKVKSAEIPENNDGPVTVVVGKTFDDIVLDESKDVFVKFYAPWCGHCKKLAPTWEELGEAFADNDNIIIAKVDSTENDTPADVKGYPTLIFYPANDKSGEMRYRGGRDLEALKEFVEENSVNFSGDADAASEKEEL